MASGCLLAYWHKIRKLAFQLIELLKGKLTSMASSQDESLVDRDAAPASGMATTSDRDQVNVFTFAEYKAYIVEANRAWWRARQAYLGYRPGWTESDAALYSRRKAAFELLFEQYRPRLPVYLLARCPLCGGKVSERVDTFSLNGFGWNNTHKEPSGWGWFGVTRFADRSYQSECEHVQLLLYGVNLNGYEEFAQLSWSTIFIGAERPYVIPPLLQIQDTYAVLHSLPLGRVSDAEFTPRYTIYFATYFSSHPEQFEQALEPYRSKNKPEKILPYDDADYDLAPWVSRGRLYWLKPNDPELTLMGGAANLSTFPYGSIPGRQGRWCLTKYQRKAYTLRQLDTFEDRWLGY
jgi:hypothetical protein